MATVREARSALVMACPSPTGEQDTAVRTTRAAVLTAATCGKLKIENDELEVCTAGLASYTLCLMDFLCSSGRGA